MDTENPTQALQTALEVELAKLHQHLERDQTVMKNEMAEAGGAHPYLQQKYPMLAQVFPSTLTEDGLLAETISYYDGAEYRLKLCANCPSYGGACKDHEAKLPKGHVPVLQNGIPSSVSCGDRWREFQIRNRLQQFGVPERLSGAVSSELTRTWTKQQKQAYGALIKDYFLSRFNEGPVGIVPGPKSTELGVAMLREILKGYNSLGMRRGLWARFVDARELLQEMHLYMDQRDERPTQVLTEVDFLVIDNVELGKFSDWFWDELSLLFQKRWQHQRGMLILSKTFTRKHDEAKYLQAFNIDSLNQIALVAT